MVLIHFADKACGCGCGAGVFGCKCANCTTTPKTEGFGGRKTVMLYYTNWCGYCKQMRPIWEAVKIRMKQEDDTIIFNENDEDKSPTPGINAYPTVIMYVDRRAYRFPGGNDSEKLYNWILNPID
ncbi:thioredoxin [Faustovirus]|nr:thioredoxin [Faustovirus]AMN84523.1 thioredoxin [Faustovirus]AMP44335.1 Thioredoxin [Faustovirus]